MRVLLVEDDLQLGESLEAALRLEQYAVDWLHSGEPVRAVLGATPYDLLVLGLSIVTGIVDQHGASLDLGPGPDGSGFCARVVFSRV